MFYGGRYVFDKDVPTLNNEPLFWQKTWSGYPYGVTHAWQGDFNSLSNELKKYIEASHQYIYGIDLCCSSTKFSYAKLKVAVFFHQQSIVGHVVYCSDVKERLCVLGWCATSLKAYNAIAQWYYETNSGKTAVYPIAVKHLAKNLEDLHLNVVCNLHTHFVEERRQTLGTNPILKNIICTMNYDLLRI